MPKFDKTGPNGEGPLTGRGQGNCIDEINCNRGLRKKCCSKIDKEFYENRLRKNRRG
ncbi:MAG: DUF5320 domain-containing protein [Clostridia bacterium]|nr:DUF5320 domain-containing protein [Clostridia bacterium]